MSRSRHIIQGQESYSGIKILEIFIIRKTVGIKDAGDCRPLIPVVHNNSVLFGCPCESRSQIEWIGIKLGKLRILSINRKYKNKTKNKYYQGLFHQYTIFQVIEIDK